MDETRTMAVMVVSSSTVTIVVTPYHNHYSHALGRVLCLGPGQHTRETPPHSAGENTEHSHMKL